MASSSGGGHGSGDQSSSFKFLTKAEVYILDENGDFEDTLDDLQEIEKCLNELKSVTVNEMKKSSMRFCGLEKGEITWAADSAAEVIQFCTAVRENNIQVRLNNYSKEKGIQDRLKLECGKVIYINVLIGNVRNLKDEANQFFEIVLDKQKHDGQVGEEDHGKKNEHDDPSGPGPQNSSSSYPSAPEPQNSSSNYPSGPGPQNIRSHDDPSGPGPQNSSSSYPSAPEPQNSSSNYPSGPGPQNSSSHDDPSGPGPQNSSSNYPSGPGPQNSSSSYPSAPEPQNSSSNYPSGPGPQNSSSHDDPSGPEPQNSSSNYPSGPGPQNIRSHDDPSGPGPQNNSSSYPSAPEPQNSSSNYPSGPGPQNIRSHDDPSGQGSQNSSSHDPSDHWPLVYSNSWQASERKQTNEVKPLCGQTSFQVCLHIDKELGAWTVKMEYYNDEGRKKNQKLEYDKHYKLWFSKPIKHQQNCLFKCGFYIYKITDVWNPSFRGQEIRPYEITSPVLRKMFKHSVDGFMNHAMHIFHDKNPKTLGHYIQELDELFKGTLFQDEEKQKLFCSLMSQVKASDLSSEAKVIYAVCYITCKLQVTLTPVGNVPQCALSLLKSFSSLTKHSLSDTQMSVMKVCADNMCKSAYPGTSCILILMKHTGHLFSSSYFKSLHERKVMTFSSGTSDNDEDLQVEMFHKLAKDAVVDCDTGYLFKLLMQDTPLQKVLKFQYEQYQYLIDKVDQLLKDRITVEIAGLQSTMDLKRFEDLSRLVSRHPSLRKQHFVNLRKLALQLLRAPPLAKSWTQEDLIRVFEVPYLFDEKPDKETLLDMISRSQHEVYHTLYWKLLDRLDIEDASIIGKTACNWLGVLINKLQVDERCKSQAESIPMLYRKLQELVEANNVRKDSKFETLLKNVRKDSKFETLLKDKVFDWLVKVDLQLVLEWGLQKDSVDRLFFEHLKKITTDHPDVLLILENALKKSDEKSLKVQGYEVISIGLDVLGKQLTKDPDENFIMMLANWRLCVAAIKLFSKLKSNTILNTILQSKERYQKSVHDKTVEVHVVTKIVNLCKEKGMDLLPFEKLLEPYGKKSAGQNLKEAVEHIEAVKKEVQHTLSVLDVIHGGLSLSALKDGTLKIIMFLKDKQKDLHIGFSVQVQMIYDRSFFDPYKALLSFSRDNFYLLESKVFLKIFLGQNLVLPKPDSLETFADVLCRELSQAKASFQDYWLRVCSADNWSDLHISDLHVVEGRKLSDEAKIAEKATGVKVPAEIYDALHLAGDYGHYMEKTDHICRVFEVLKLDIGKDKDFITAVDGIKSLADKTDTCSLATLVNVSQTFKKVNKMLDTDTQDMLKEFSKSQTLFEFIREIQEEDLRNLIDAVEEHSEQSVQEITVSSLIDVRRFLKPFLEADLTNSVVEVLTIMNTSKTENKLTYVATKLQECNTNLHSLKSLYRNVANRGEVTKDIVKAIVQDDNVEVLYEICTNKKVNMMVKYKDDRKLNKNELNDYRSRALLLVNTDTSDTSENSNSQIRQFIEFVDSALTTSSLYEQLVQSGYPEVYITVLSVKRAELHKRETSLKKRLLRWESALEDARKNWYWLNHFYPEQITKIQDFMKDGVGASEVRNLFRSAGCLKDWSDSDITYPDLKNRMTRLYVNKMEIMENDEFSLNAIGATLEELMNNEIAVGPTFPDDTVEKQRVRPLDKVQNGELYIVNLADNSNIIPTLMTLYRNTTGHVPCHHQILFCTEQTSWESILLLLNKCVYGKKRGFQKQLYCIVSVEKLCNEEQFKLVSKLKELGDSINYLAVICKGQSNHPLTNHFSEQVHKLKPMLNKDLENGFQTLWPGVSLLTSDLPGQGKTEMAQLQALDQGLDFISCHTSGLVSEETLIRKLSELDLHEKSLLHLDVGSLSNGPDADILLFKFVAFGFLSSGAKIFSRQTSHIVVEIANSINGTLQNSLPTTQYLKCEHLKWKNFRNYRVSQELNSPVQVVCHYLAAYRKGTLDDADIYFSGDRVEEPLPEKECQHLMREMFSLSCDLSFSVMNILLNVLADQLKKMSCSLFLRTSHLFEMVGENNVKSSLVRAVLEASKGFATRSISTCREEEQAETVKSKTEFNIVKSKGTSEVATASAMTTRLRGMIQWEESNHLVISFHNQDIQTLSALYRDKSKVPEHVKNLFETQVKQDLPDYSQMSSAELIKRLEQIARSKPPSEEASEWNISASYAMTPDNLLKMILIIMRMKSHVPVIIMGETGCGKTSLLRQLSRVCDVTFLVRNMHAGIELGDIAASVDNACTIANQNLKEHVWLFFDEINTCDHMGLLNDLLCHHVYNGQNLPPNLSILAACNPYKLRQESNMLTAGLVTKIKTDEQSKLVYRVHPLSESMVDYVWDFGSLTDADEKAYIKSMVETSLEHVESDLFVDLLVMSQEFIRQVDKSPFSVSLRDVNRCRLLVPWFRDSMLPKLSNQKIPHLFEIEAIIMALAHSYHSRLNQTEDREKYRENIANILKRHGAVSSPIWDCSGYYVFSIIQQYQQKLLDKMTLPSGIARNTALQENVFVIFVCLLKRMPIFVVGKPGCSKSLSLQLLKSNLRGKDSDKNFFKTLPQLYYVSFQGSESSTSDGILKVFEKAQNYRKHNQEEDVLPVVILDEIGLAEISSYNPLKVLHSLLEPENKEFPDVAVVGISNWALDAAKMNRAIHLSRPEMSESELHTTAISIAEANSEEQASQQRSLSDRDKKILESLASAYFYYVGQQKHKNFHGLRDFYSLIKFFSRKTSMHTMSETETYFWILTGLLRNFGLLTSERKVVIDTFNQHLKDFRRNDFDRACPSLLDLVHQNITDCHARHLMLMTRGDSSLGIVEDLLRTNERQFMTILGSSFEEDQSDHYSYRILNRIILCMEQGITMILKDLETIYGSLYDMLNQNYTVVGSKKNCRIALGQHSNPLCQVHERFRCIVLVEEQKVDFTDPPFLNRFEKQRLVISDVLNEEMKELAKKLKTTMEDLSKVSEFQAISPAQLVPIFNSDMIPSLVHGEFKLKQDLKTSDIEKNCWQRLLTLCTPEGMVRAEKSALKTNDGVKLKSMREDYFKQKVLDGLESYLYHLMKQFEEGVAAMIFTHSNIYTDLSELLKDFPSNCQFEKLGAFKSEKQLTTQVKRFFSDTEQAWFFIQVSHTDQQHFLLMKSILEQERKLHLTAETDTTAIKHVVIIIHIDRTDENRNEMVNFLSGWHLSMMDTLAKQQLSLRQMLNGSLVDLSRKLLSDNGINRQKLFSAFTFINYTAKIRPMGSIKELINTILQNDVIKKVLYDLVNDWISNEPSLKRNQDWQLDVACSTAKLKTHLTFHGALLEEVKSKISHPLAAAVFTIEKFNGWDYLTPGKDITDSNDRVKRWQSLASSKQIVDITEVAEPKGIECYPCRLTTLDTKFPFSNFFIQKIETLNDVFLDICRGQQLETDNEVVDEIMCAKLSSMFRSSVKAIASQLLDSCLEKKDIHDYFSDYCQWFAADIPLNMSDDQRIEVIMQAIKSRTDLEERDLDLFVTKIHVSGWLYKYKLQSEIILIDTCLSQLQISLEDILSKTYKKKRSHEHQTQRDSNIEISDNHTSRQNHKMPLEDTKEEIDEHGHDNRSDSKGNISETRAPFEIENAGAGAGAASADNDNNEGDEADDEKDTIAASLVDFVCQYLDPSEQMKTKSVSEWQSMVNLVLSLTIDVSGQPVILETLRACNDLASMLLLPHNINERYFWSIGTKIFKTKSCLDSEVVIDDIIIFLSEVNAFLPPHEIQHFLSSYASCCLMANTQSSFIFKMFHIRRCININIHEIEFLGTVFHNAIFLQYEADPEELLDERNPENDLFTSLQVILKTSQTDRIDSPLACVVIDVLQNHIFNNLIKQVEDDIQGFLEKLLELKRQYINREPNTIRSLIVIGYLKASLQHLASYLWRQKHFEENIWQKINHLFEDGNLAISSRVQSLQAFFLCCLVKKGGLFAVETVREKFIQCKFLSEINTVFEKDLQANEQNPWYLHCKDQYQVVRKAASEIHQRKEPLCEIFFSAVTDFDLSYALFAFGMNEFYLVKGRNLKKHEEEIAQQLVAEAKDKLPCHKHRLFSSLCQQEDFSSKLFQIQTSPAEHHMVLSILDILSTVFSSIDCLDTSGDQHVLVDCICNPLSTVGRPIPGLPDYDNDVHPLVMKELRETSLFTYDCKCGCRLLFKEENNFLHCPNCKSEISKDDEISIDVAVMDDDSTSGMTDMDEKSASEEMEFCSVSKSSCCPKFCEIGSMETVRGMSPTSLRVMQFIYYGCLAGGAALGYSTEDDLHSRLHLDDKADPVKTLNSYLLHQWECLKTILSMGDEQLSRFLNIVIFRSRGLLIKQIWRFQTARERNEFEHIFTETLTPFVKRRFDLIAEHVKLFNETCSEKEGFLEDILCETQREEQNKEGLPQFWRQITQPSTDNLKSEFFLSESFEAFPILALVFMYEKELKLMKHITSLIQWHNCTVKHISYRYKKTECEDKTLAQFLHSLKENETSKKEVKRALDKFTEAWKDITRMKEVIDKYTCDIGTFKEVHVHPNIELHKCIIMSQDSQVYQVLRGLITMQNRFLDEAMNITVLHQVPSSSFLMRSKGCASAPIVRVEDVAEHQVVNEPDFTDLLMFSQCNTKYAHGQEVFYDFYQIEREIALQCLMKKTHIVLCDSFPMITFSGELLHTASTLLCEIEKLVHQHPETGPETVHQLSKMDPANRNVLMNYLEMTFFLIKRKIVSSEEQTMADFLENWKDIFHYRVSAVDDFCSNVYLCHTVALYELVEQYMVEDMVLLDSYKESMPSEGEMTLEGNDFADEMYLQAVVSAMTKFAYRNQQRAEVDRDKQMSGLLKDTSLWPRGHIPKLNSHQEGSYRSQDLLPPSICVKHICCTIEFIKEKLKKQKESATLEIQQEKKNNKVQKRRTRKKSQKKGARRQ